MGRIKKKYTAQFKAKVAFEAAKGDRNITEIASEYGVHPQQVRAWRREFLEKMHLVFEKEKDTAAIQKELAKAYQKIGQLEVERDFLSGLLKKVLSKRERVRMVKNRRFPKKFSLKKVCELLKVSRSTVYYKEKGKSKENQRLMEEIEEIYAHDPKNESDA